MATQNAINGRDSPKLHFVLVPPMAQGHTIPMIDMARLLASRGVHVSVITTSLNAARIKTVIDRVKASQLPIQFVSLSFPCSIVGLPEGCENIDTLPSNDHLKSFLDACALLGEPLILHLKEQKLPPSCIISYFCHIWTGDVAREFRIPRFAFNGFGGFSTLCRHIVLTNELYKNISDEMEVVVVPGFPHHLELPKGQLPSNVGGRGMDKFFEELKEDQPRLDGIIINTFDDLEALYIESYQKAIAKKVWTIGPMSLYNKDAADMAARGNLASIDGNRCLRWLDSMKPSSVIYVSFGSIASPIPPQLVEIGLGLEASNRPFIWVIKAGDKSPEVEKWLSEGFEERVRSRGLIIRGWAPQVMILSHPAIGGFMTHCGWNSTLEGVATGVPMITWPHFGEQFLNEKLMVEVLKIGVAVGVKKMTRWGIKNSEVLVKRKDVQKAVSALMDEGEDGVERKKRVRKMGEKARKAMEEGGSSYGNMTLLAKHVQRLQTNMLAPA
ncbi:UDP-glycosyltransferase 73C3-like [Phoenix dactylifera]|uniref:Glycosyltransferase n=1 Tax=Phoenix dactylifera TaxID=42345 RepID=A0A8B7MV55_PHODC|nr:UDP-glycosyltransferase 73C3-like [Phoenix dactylifera]